MDLSSRALSSQSPRQGCCTGYFGQLGFQLCSQLFRATCFCQYQVGGLHFVWRLLLCHVCARLFLISRNRRQGTFLRHNFYYQSSSLTSDRHLKMSRVYLLTRSVQNTSEHRRGKLGLLPRKCCCLTMATSTPRRLLLIMGIVQQGVPPRLDPKLRCREDSRLGVDWFLH